MAKKIIHIRGMHCRSCEMLIEDRLVAIPGVKKARVSYQKGVAEIEFDREPDEREIRRAIEAAGYSIGRADVRHFFSRNVDDYIELIIAALALSILYMVLKRSGIADIGSLAAGASGTFGPLLVGLVAGVSTCMALIGGLVLGMSARHAKAHPEATALERFRPHIFFNVGRLVSYALLGGLIGLLGSAFRLSSSLQGVITIVLGIVMLFLGAKLVGVFPRLESSAFALPKGISRFFGLRGDAAYSHRSAFATGALTFFVPCGFTQAMQLAAIASGSFAGGAVIMGLFALGTLPGIIGIGGLASAVRGAFARYFFRIAGVIVISLALFNISSGYALSGFSIDSGVAPNYVPKADHISVTGGQQIVQMTQLANGYSPNRFTVKRGVPVVWKIQSTTQYSCAAYISMPAMGISQPLRAGENVIEFTPTRTGALRFTCSMGMYSGVFNVVD